MAFTVLTGEIAHETNTFSIEATTLERFRQRRVAKACKGE